jgi:hypothetical protein
MTKKKNIPDVEEILQMVDEKLKYSIKKPDEAKQSHYAAIAERRKRAEESFFKDFTSITFGDYINAIHSFNREMMSNMDPIQKAAYYTFFAYEESIKRIDKAETEIN